MIDDEPRGITSLLKLLTLNCPQVEIIQSCNSVEEAKQQIILLKPDLVFLDIAMPGKSGLDLLDELAVINFEIIFVTAHNNYMQRAFHFSAVDYLIKPVDEELLIEAVTRAVKRVEQRSAGKLNTTPETIDTFLHNMQKRVACEKMKLCIPSLKGFQVVQINEIIYCEAYTNYTNFYFTNRSTICASKSLHEYEELLADCNFIRIHKSFMVNLEHIKEYLKGEGGSVILSNGNEVEVSRRKKDLLMLKMKAFYKF